MAQDRAVLLRRKTSQPPIRLIDPDGEGVYKLAGDFSLRLNDIAWELFGDARRWRDLDYETVWMREREGHWHPTRWRWWHGLLPAHLAPVAYAYVTPKRGAQ